VQNAFIRLKPLFLKMFYKNKSRKDLNTKVKQPNDKRKFTWKNKTIVRLKNKWGLAGIIVFTPSFLSIPLGSFLASRYYKERKYVLFYLSISVIIWSFVLSSIGTLF